LVCFDTLIEVFSFLPLLDLFSVNTESRVLWLASRWHPFFRPLVLLLEDNKSSRY
jgi:hypothetical protein